MKKPIWYGQLSNGDGGARDWPLRHFGPEEVACKCCGQIVLDVVSGQRLDLIRHTLERPVHLTSAYRCPVHNRTVGGSTGSFHLTGRAFDISATGPDRLRIITVAAGLGFRGFGLYGNFVHVDTRGPIDPLPELPPVKRQFAYGSHWEG